LGAQAAATLAEQHGTQSTAATRVYVPEWQRERHAKARRQRKQVWTCSFAIG
jgi:hypothetical protein